MIFQLVKKIYFQCAKDHLNKKTNLLVSSRYHNKIPQIGKLNNNLFSQRYGAWKYQIRVSGEDSLPGLLDSHGGDRESMII
jgi:hypothetical protein